MNITVETQCKFCHKPIFMDVDKAGYESRMVNAEVWLRNLCCNRCSEFYREKQSLVESIGRACELIQLDRENKARTKLRQKLVDLTQRLSKLVCDFKFLETVWDDEFVCQLMEKPAQSYRIVNFYCRALTTLQPK